MEKAPPCPLHQALLTALSKADNNQTKFAGEIAKFTKGEGPSQQLVSYWVNNGRPLPPKFVIPAERAGFGSRHELRPDIYPIEHPADLPIRDAQPAEAHRG